jgi:hypothetical protein
MELLSFLPLSPESLLVLAMSSTFKAGVFSATMASVFTAMLMIYCGNKSGKK